MSRTAWIAAGLVAQLLMLAVLAMTVQSRFAKRAHYYVDGLQSYTYAVLAAAIGMAGSLLQIPVAVYLMCKRRMTPSTLVLDVSMYADIVVTVVLASGVGAGFAATGDLVRRANHGCGLPMGGRRDAGIFGSHPLLPYYYKGNNIAIVFLLVGTVLSLCATIVSVRLRVRASNDESTTLTLTTSDE